MLLLFRPSNVPSYTEQETDGCWLSIAGSTIFGRSIVVRVATIETLKYSVSRHRETDIDGQTIRGLPLHYRSYIQSVSICFQQKPRKCFYIHAKKSKGCEICRLLPDKSIKALTGFFFFLLANRLPLTLAMRIARTFNNPKRDSSSPKNF